MAFNINEIRAQLAQGGARPALFQAIITNPVNPIGDLKTPFMLRATALPSWNLGTIEVPYYGRRIKVAGTRTFNNWSATIMNDEDFLIRNALEQWSNSINSLEGNLVTLGGSAPSLYKSQGTITQFSKTNQVVRVYQFNGIWPVNISDVALDWQNGDAIEEFNVEFAYDSYQIISGVTGNAGGV